MYHRKIHLFILLFFTSLAFATDTSTSYQSAANQYLKASEQSGSVFSDRELAIMQQANDSLAKEMPSPGIPIGQIAPDFTLKNPFGEKVTLSNELTKGPVILVFYRGAWCPFCNIHLRVLQQSLPELEKYNAQLIAISPQLPDQSAQQIKQSDYTFKVLSDIDDRVSKAYRLYFELSPQLLTIYKNHGLDLEMFNGQGRSGLPVPGTFVIDTKGVIHAMHAQTDYKQRMEPKAILEALKTIKVQ